MAQVRVQVEPLEAFPSREYQEGDVILNEAFTVSKSATATLTDSEQNVLVDASGGVLTLTLPSPAEGRSVFVKKVDSSVNNVTVDTTGAADIDGADSVALTTQWDYIWLISDGTDWFIKSSVIT